MELENNPARQARDGSADTHPQLISSFLDKASDGQQHKVQVAGLEELFGDPVIDSRMGKNLPTDIFGSYNAKVENCDKHAPTKSQKDSLDSTAMGNSLLHRLYEVSVLTPQSKVSANDFDKVFGKPTADKMDELGITDVTRTKQNLLVHLKNPIHYGDSSGSIDIEKAVSFASYPNGGALTLDNVSGVTASSGIFQLAVNRVELQPRKDGYMSGTVTASWSETKVCALPDGTIIH